MSNIIKLQNELALKRYNDLIQNLGYLNLDENAFNIYTPPLMIHSYVINIIKKNIQNMITMML